jgi:hypothetical protein
MKSDGICSIGSNRELCLKAIIIKITDSFRKSFGIIKKYSRENWGFPFIVAFIVLLSLAAVLLASTDPFSWANPMAVGAYITLVIGAILQIISYSKQTKNP